MIEQEARMGAPDAGLGLMASMLHQGSFQDRVTTRSTPTDPRVIGGSGCLGDLGVGVELSGDLAVLTLRGEVDTWTAPMLGAALHEVIDSGCRYVVLDLADLEFVDASGLGVMATAARRLRLRRGALTVRSPPAMVNRILALTGLDSVIITEVPR
jgi:anti-sigma B factor antagonist